MKISKIISGGQTGADRAALDFAIQSGIPHGGWCPLGRTAEDGIIPDQYQLQEMSQGGYRQRTRQNIMDSDGSLILNTGVLDVGTFATVAFAKQLKKPYLLIDFDDPDVDAEITQTKLWIEDHSIEILNIAGPRESKRPGIYEKTQSFLNMILHVR